MGIWLRKSHKRNLANEKTCLDVRPSKLSMYALTPRCNPSQNES
jgi:hypothetical protein